MSSPKTPAEFAALLNRLSRQIELHFWKLANKVIVVLVGSSKTGKSAYVQRELKK